MSEISNKKRKSGNGESKDRSKKRKMETTIEPDLANHDDRKKSKKRKREEANGDNSVIPDTAEPAVSVSKKSKPKKPKRQTKDLSRTSGEVEPQMESALSNQPEREDDKSPKQPKSLKKSKNKRKSTASPTNEEPQKLEPAKEAKSKQKRPKKKKQSKSRSTESGDPKEAGNARGADDQPEEATKSRFIVFIGMEASIPPFS